MLAANQALGECGMLAASFILVCQMLGVTGAMEIGRIFPWARRGNDAETEPPFAPRVIQTHGKYNQPDTRAHLLPGHGPEQLAFLDKNDKLNHFEGVARYLLSNLYGIGENIPQSSALADGNASLWYEVSDFKLLFRCTDLGSTRCAKAYPKTIDKTVFKWND